MKNLKYIMLALACSLMTSCIYNDYEQTIGDESPYGDNSLTESNLLTIQQLKTKYKKQLSTDYRDGVSYAQVQEPTQIKGYVTGNDITGNLYNEVAIQDETGAIIVAI